MKKLITKHTNDQYRMAGNLSFRAQPLIFFILLLFALPSTAQDKPSGGEIEMDPKYATIRWRFSIMPILSFYDANTSYLESPKATQGLGLSAKAEFKLSPRSTTKLIVGLEYLNEGMKFDSYYFAPGHSVLFDKNYNYTHKLHISQVYLPILFKQSFGDEDRKANTAYISGGWAFRYLMGTHYKISSKTDGNTIDQGFSPMTVEHKFITETGGSALVGGMGFEHKLAGMKRAVFFEMYYHYNLSRIHYIGNNHTNNIRFRNHSLTIGVGYEF
jgi:hypothetical protein